MPVGNGFGGRVVGINSRQLGQGDGHGPALPADQHEHIGGAGIFRCHTLDFDGFSLPERRNYRDRDALGLKRKLYFVIEVAMPSHDLLFRPIGVRDGFVVDSVLSDGIFLGFLHDFAPRIRRTDVRPIRNRRAISDLLTPARYSLRMSAVCRAAVAGRPSPCRFVGRGPSRRVPVPVGSLVRTWRKQPVTPPSPDRLVSSDPVPHSGTRSRLRDAPVPEAWRAGPLPIFPNGPAARRGPHRSHGGAPPPATSLAVAFGMRRNRFPSPAGRSTSRAEQRSPSGRESAMGWSIGHWWTRERIGRHETFSTASVPGQKPYAILRFERPAFWPFSSDALAWPKRILFGQAGFSIRYAASRRAPVRASVAR